MFRTASFPRTYRHSSTLHHFDTYKFVQRLEGEGFPRESSEAIMNSLAEVVSESVTNFSRSIVTKSEFEKVG